MKIIIKNFIFYSFVGVHDEEKSLGQRFIASLKIDYDYINDDNISNALNYSSVCKDVNNIGLNSKFNLIETLTLHIADEFLKKYKIINKISVEIKKPHAPMNHSFDYVSSKIKRKQNYL